MFSKSLVAASVLAAVANSQTIVTSSAASVAPSRTVSQSMPAVATASFNSANVSDSTKFSWCLAQRNTCPQICGGAASTNQCDQTALTYSCICPNGTVPDVTAFADTLPYFMCQATYAQCVIAHPNDAEGQATCMANEQCGSRNATAEALAATSAGKSGSASSTASKASSTGTGSASATSASASASSTAKSSANINSLATGAFAAVFFAAFKMLL